MHISFHLTTFHPTTTENLVSETEILKKHSILRLKPGIINNLKRPPFLWLQSIDFYNKEAAQYIYPTRNILPTEENLWTALKILENVNDSGFIHTTAIEKKCELLWTQAYIISVARPIHY